jgi:predicted esterase
MDGKGLNPLLQNYWMTIHPPTLFLHGALDTTVPEYTARQYFTALGNDGVTTDFVSAPLVGHAWLDVAPAVGAKLASNVALASYEALAS